MKGRGNSLSYYWKLFAESIHIQKTASQLDEIYAKKFWNLGLDFF